MVTSDLGRVTTSTILPLQYVMDCGDVRSRTSYNSQSVRIQDAEVIVVTSDLGRVTTPSLLGYMMLRFIVVTSDLGRVTTEIGLRASKLSILW